MRLPLLIISICLLLNTAWGQLYINEVCPKNVTIILDEDGNSSDWMELYNAGDEDVDLTGYFLSDDASNLKKWKFPSTELADEEYLLVFASGKGIGLTELHTGFELVSAGETVYLSDPNGDLLHSFNYGYTESDISHGYAEDNFTNAYIITNPTPAAVNDTVGRILGYTPAVQFNYAAGFYDEPITLELSVFDNSVIRYTLDGRVPNLNSDLYTSPLSIDTTVVVKARAFSDQFKPGPLEVNTYFINERYNLPVVSLSTAPANLWSDSAGIYVSGPNASPNWPFWGSNFWQDWEVPVYVEFFEDDLTLAFEQGFGAKIHGAGSRTQAMKSLRLFSRSEYGPAWLDYPLFTDRDENLEYKRIILRNGGQGFNKTHLRDAIIHTAVGSGFTHLDYMTYRPAILLFNGEYQGITNIRDRIDKYYLQAQYDINLDSLDILENNTSPVEGQFTDFLVLYDFVRNNQMDSTNYAWVKERLDWENMVDYFIVENYFHNTDWPTRNLEFWKAEAPHNRWRYLLFDMDLTMGHWEEPFWENTFNRWADINGSYHLNMFYKLLDNEEYRQYFVNRYADLLNTRLRADFLNELTRKLADDIRPEIEQHLNYYGRDLESWHYELNWIYDWIGNRTYTLRQHMLAEFELEKEVGITLNVFPNYAGQIQINTINPSAYPWYGIYFDGVPVDISVIEFPGFEFSHWEVNGFEIADLESSAFEVNLDKESQVKAIFLTENSSAPIHNFSISPNPVSDILNIQMKVVERSNALIEVMDAKGIKVATLFEGTLHVGTESMQFNVGTLQAGTYILRLDIEGELSHRKFVVN